MLRISIDNAAGGSVRAKCSSKFRILKVGKSERNEELPDLAFLLAIITFVAGERGGGRERERDRERENPAARRFQVRIPSNVLMFCPSRDKK